VRQAQPETVVRETRENVKVHVEHVLSGGGPVGQQEIHNLAAQ